MALVFDYLERDHDSWVDLFGRILRTFEVSLLHDLHACLGCLRVQRDVEDRLVWKNDSARNFFMRALYHLMVSFEGVINEEECAIWKVCVPPKIQCFLWFIVVGWLPTLSMLRERGMPIAAAESLCHWYGLEEESANHLFIRCCFAWEI
ncbi:hypothetical protein V6N13_114310 [Hibiscus sabdariffa]